MADAGNVFDGRIRRPKHIRADPGRRYEHGAAEEPMQKFVPFKQDFSFIQKAGGRGDGAAGGLAYFSVFHAPFDVKLFDSPLTIVHGLNEVGEVAVIFRNDLFPIPLIQYCTT